MHPVVRDYLRPWKLGTLAGGIVLLLAGSALTPMPDWDVGVSLLMAGLTYLASPWVARIVVGRRWQHLPWAACLTWGCVDGAYWSLLRPDILYMRAYQWPLSLWLFGACAALWCHDGTLASLRDTLGAKAHVRKARR